MATTRFRSNLRTMFGALPIPPSIVCSACRHPIQLMSRTTNTLSDVSVLVLQCCFKMTVPLATEWVTALLDRAERRTLEQRTADLWLFADGLYLCDHDVAPRLFVARSSSPAS